MSDNGVTSIVFLPVCSNCLNIIWQTVNYEERIGIARGISCTIGDDITPNKCPHCGSTHIDHYDRIIGYLTKISNWSEGRQIEQKTRVYSSDIE